MQIGKPNLIQIRIPITVATIPFVLSRIFDAIPTESLQQHPLLFAMSYTHRIFFS